MKFIKNKKYEIYCYSRDGQIYQDWLVIPSIKGYIIDKRNDGKVEFQEDGSSNMHYVYPQQIREIKKK